MRKNLEIFRTLFKLQPFNINNLPFLIRLQKKRILEYSNFKSKEVINLKKSKNVSFLQNRETIRKFSSYPMKRDVFFNIIINSLCSRVNAKTTRPYSLPKRTYPSAGGLNMVEFLIYINKVNNLAKGYYLLDPYKKKLLKIELNLPIRNCLKYAENVNLENSCFTIFFLGDLNSGVLKYGLRAYKYCLLEAGHAAQNLLLCSSHFGFEGVCLGAFEQIDIDNKKTKIFKQKHLEYVVVVGKHG